MYKTKHGLVAEWDGTGKTVDHAVGNEMNTYPGGAHWDADQQSRNTKQVEEIWPGLPYDDC